jgi:hypothetical protein
MRTNKVGLMGSLNRYLRDTTTTSDVGAYVPSRFGRKVARAHYPGDIKDDSGEELEIGFSLSDLEDYVLAHEDDIRDALQRYWGSADAIKSISNYYDLASVLDCDSRVLRDVDLRAITNFIYGLLSGGVEDSKDDIKTVDLIWALHSAGIPYESRASLGGDKDEYREYLFDLVRKHGLSDLVGLGSGSDVSDSGSVYELEHLDPKTSWKVLTERDASMIRTNMRWTEDEVKDYVDYVLTGKDVPIFFNFFEGAILGGYAVKNSKSIQDFLKFNRDSIRIYAKRLGFSEGDDYDLFLKSYVDYLMESYLKV